MTNNFFMVIMRLHLSILSVGSEVMAGHNLLSGFVWIGAFTHSPVSFSKHSLAHSLWNSLSWQVPNLEESTNCKTDMKPYPFLATCENMHHCKQFV